MLPREKGSSPLHNPLDPRCVEHADEQTADAVCSLCIAEARERAQAYFNARELGS